jgi:hypothetical protein
LEVGIDTRTDISAKGGGFRSKGGGFRSKGGGFRTKGGGFHKFHAVELLECYPHPSLARKPLVNRRNRVVVSALGGKMTERRIKNKK